MTTSKDYDEKYANGWMTLIRGDNERGSHSDLDSDQHGAMPHVSIWEPS